MDQMTTNSGRCLCGAELDENGRCPRQERAVFRGLVRGAMVNYVDGRSFPKWPDDKVEVITVSERVFDLSQPIKLSSED